MSVNRSRLREMARVVIEDERSGSDAKAFRLYMTVAVRMNMDVNEVRRRILAYAA